jgi:hypothetical protein
MCLDVKVDLDLNVLEYPERSEPFLGLVVSRDKLMTAHFS